MAGKLGWLALLVGIVIAAHAEQASEPSRSLTLNEAVAIGLKQATSVLKAGNDVELTGKQVLQGYGQFLPNLAALGTYSYSAGRNYVTLVTPTLIDSRNYGLSLQLSTTLNLFNGLSDYASLKNALESRDQATLTLERAKQQIVIDMTQAFLQVILDKHIVVIGEANLKASTDRETLLRNQVAVGARSLADLVRQEAETASNQAYLIDARNRLHDDAVKLLERLRLDTAGKYEYQEPPLELPPAATKIPDMSTLTRLALDKRPDLGAYEHRWKATDWSVTRARADYYPKLDLGLSVYSTGRVLNSLTVNGVASTPASQRPLFTQLGDQTYYVVGLTLTWSVFDRFLTTLDVERARVAADNARLDYDDRRIQVTGDVRQATTDFNGALERLQAAHVGLRSAQTAYDIVQAKYEVGAASFIDLVTAQSVLVQARVSDIQALVQAYLQRRIVDFVTGTLAP